MRHGIRGRIMASAVVAFGLVAGLSACGSEDEEPLAELAPASATLYAEAAADPNGYLELRLDVLSSRLHPEIFASFRNEIENLVNGWLFRRSFDVEIQPGFDPTELPGAEELAAVPRYEDAIEPWLGDRVAIFTVPDEEGEDSFTAGIIDVDDTEAAADAVETLAGDSSYTGRVGDVEFEVDDEFAVGLVGDRMLVGDEEAVRAALEDDTPLAEADWFREGLEQLPAREQALGYAVADGSRLFDLVWGQPPLPLSEEETEGMLRRLFIDPEGPITFELGTERGSLRLDVGYATDQPVDVETTSRMLGALPADSWAAIGDAIQLPLFVEGIKIGFRKELERQAERLGLSTRRLLRQARFNLGFDLEAGLEEIGEAAVLFARGATAPELVTGLFVDTPRPSFFGGPIDAVGFFLDVQRGVKLRRLPRLPDSPYGFAAQFPGLPVPINLAQGPRALGALLAVNPDALRHGLEPPEQLRDTDKLDDVAADLGDGFTGRGFVELGSVVDVVEALGTPDEEGLAEAREAFDDVVLQLGGRQTEGRYVLRLRLDAGE